MTEILKKDILMTGNNIFLNVQIYSSQSIKKYSGYFLPAHLQME